MIVDRVEKRREGTKTMPRKTYINPPKHCDLCRTPISKSFVDGATKMGPWANMCLDCHRMQGRGLGLGKGQQYQNDGNGTFVKIAG